MEKTYLHRSPQPIAPHFRSKDSAKPPGDSSFAVQLDKAIQASPQLQLSKHAKVRMEQRGISITPQTWEKIGKKVDEAKSKGVSDSLVILKDAALIVSAKNKTVITALDRLEAHSHIFTNINGTILID
ncbi:TIGR02530 family flagellar biosynthesis protein [Rossellomorea sp. AcN35-11]|nr:flagellar protein [Rossellomorea aquimaris]NMH71180.1 flagellar protein [Bacillus sp. RO3]WJV28910.1 TIGR02530 family flagellar biosynthesis protein [Rossellomorea sp. AcN35-11]